jgi:hypothetical protein
MHMLKRFEKHFFFFQINGVAPALASSDAYNILLRIFRESYNSLQLTNHISLNMAKHINSYMYLVRNCVVSYRYLCLTIDPGFDDERTSLQMASTWGEWAFLLGKQLNYKATTIRSAPESHLSVHAMLSSTSFYLLVSKIFFVISLVFIFSLFSSISSLLLGVMWYET